MAGAPAPKRAGNVACGSPRQCPVENPAAARLELAGLSWRSLIRLVVLHSTETFTTPAYVNASATITSACVCVADSGTVSARRVAWPEAAGKASAALALPASRTSAVGFVAGLSRDGAAGVTGVERLNARAGLFRGDFIGRKLPALMAACTPNKHLCFKKGAEQRDRLPQLRQLHLPTAGCAHAGRPCDVHMNRHHVNACLDAQAASYRLVHTHRTRTLCCRHLQKCGYTLKKNSSL